jgi:hypothetical protein
MPIIGIELNKKNPEYTISDFTMWFPQFTNFMKTEEGTTYFNNLYEVANGKIFKSIWGSDWKLAMGYCIAHYLELISQQVQSPSGSTLGEIAGGGVHKGILTGASIGGFNKSLDFNYTMKSSDEMLFWNQTSYGASLMALYKTKAVPSIFVVRSNV